MRKGIVIVIVGLFIEASIFTGFSSEEPREVAIQMNNDDGLVGYWDFNEGLDNIAKDSSTYNNHGEIYGATWDKEGFYGSALNFDGDWDYVLIQDDDSLNFADTNEFTLDVWIKWFGDIIPNEPGDFIIHKQYYGGYALRVIQHNGTLGFSHGIVNNEINLYSKSKVIDREWHHIIAVWDGSNSYLFIDGILEDTRTDIGYKTANSLKPLEIGNNWGYTDNDETFDGIIDEVKIYEKAVFPIKKLPNPLFAYPSDEEIVKGNVTIYGEVNEIYEDITGVEVSINGTDNWETVNGTHWFNKYLWEYTFNSYDYNTGNLSIYARSFKNQTIVDSTYSDIVQRFVHVDNYGKLPAIIIYPKDENFTSGIIEFEGEASDNDGHITNIQIKINDREWQEVFKMLPKWKSDEWNTIEEDDETYYIYARCQDNDSYWSPVKEIKLTVDNHIPNAEFIMPKENHIYLFWKITKFERDTAVLPFLSKTLVLGELPVRIEILSNYNWVDKDQVMLYLNNEESGYRFDEMPNTHCFENEQWNYRSLGQNCTLRVEVANTNFHKFISQIEFTYWNLKGI
ncbi:MAG: LamG domain-containing protein [Candidatus Thermoplasmatota archaeon]|nr:LamG domain-containing protein [Candidatus Thermoplasmatota archaeon]